MVALWGHCAITTVIAVDEVPAGGGEDSQSSAGQLYTLDGNDASLADLLASGAIVPGQRFGNGMYLGQKKGGSVGKDAMYFVTGATIR